eukprot:2682287-Amphidinium_carterae.1
MTKLGLNSNIATSSAVETAPRKSVDLGIGAGWGQILQQIILASVRRVRRAVVWNFRVWGLRRSAHVRTTQAQVLVLDTDLQAFTRMWVLFEVC